MEIARAREILDPEHREAYESLEPVNEACRMGVEALRRRVPESPYPDGDAGVLACPSCGSGEYLHNEDGNRCRFCGQCGQAIEWGGDAVEEASGMKLCDRCRVAGCLLNYGGKACKNARKQNCPDVVFTNADRVREMNDEELAKFMLSSNGAAYCKNNDRDSMCYLKGRDGMTACELCALDWLREEAE